MSNKTVIESLEANIKQNQEFLDMGHALTRLKSNKDFLKLVKNGYFEKEAIRLVHLKADPAMQKPESQASIVGQIDAIGHFSSYLRTVEMTADRAELLIEADRATIDELHAEEA